MSLHIRFLYLSIFLSLIYSSLSARELDGFIVFNNGNKIEGKIRVTSVNYPTGAITVNNINYVPLYVSVFFKENGTRRFKEYYANDIDRFGFVYDGQDIYFFSVALPVKEWNQFKYKKKFLRLLVNGQLVLYDNKSLVKFGNDYTEITDYFISDNHNNVTNVADNEYATFEDYLVKGLKIDKEFLKNQPYKINIRNIRDIIYNYNKWKRVEAENQF